MATPPSAAAAATKTTTTAATAAAGLKRGSFPLVVLHTTCAQESPEYKSGRMAIISSSLPEIPVVSTTLFNTLTRTRKYTHTHTQTYRPKQHIAPTMDILNLNQYKDPVDWDSMKSNLLFLGHGPSRLASMVAVYLLFVLKVGPQLMHKKQPFDLRRIVRLYNFVNIIFNIWLAYRGIYLSGAGASFFNCHCLDRDPKKFSVYIDIFILSRVIDFLDTIFFILRKKQNQVTGLHVFHHACVPLVIYLVASFSMTPFSGFLIVMNALVHIVMYSYYYLATFPTLAPYLWWKRYITRIQIGQFCMALVYFSLGYILLPRFCNDPPMVAVVTNLLSALVFLVLFLSFYSGAYSGSSKQKLTPTPTATTAMQTKIK